MIKLDTILKLGKSMTTKATKDEAGVPTTVCVTKFAELQVDRDSIDELIGMPVGWCSLHLYDEQGAPVRRFGVSVFGRTLRVSGAISGPKGDPTLPLLQAELTDAHLTLMPLGAIVEGTLTWGARGDEIEDITGLQGALCRAKWEITDGDQADMFSPTSQGAAQATNTTASILANLGKGGEARP
jgi:hypothetical protein